MIRIGRRRRKPVFIQRRRRRNFVPLLTFLTAVVLLIWLIFRFFALLFSDVRSEDASAEIQILRGRAEFTLAESESWTPAYSEQKFLEGDALRTGGNSRISLEFLGGNMIFLDENSELLFEELEERSSGKKFVRLVLRQGKMWARVSEEDFQRDSDSSFEVFTDRMIVHVRGTIFDLETGPIQDSIRLIKGNVDADVFLDEDKEETKNISVSVGQKLIVSPTTLEQIKSGGEVLEIVDTEFIESEWHLQNLERFFPQEVSQIRRRIEITAPGANPATPTMPQDSGLEPPKILAPVDGTRIPAEQDAVKLEGTAPLQAAQIMINGYTLTKFQSGDRKWAYFAAKKFGTLVSGENTFSVVALTRDGKASPPAVVKVFYEGTGLNPTQVVSEALVGDFKAPIVTKPAVISADQPYQTSSEVVTFSGLVDPKTNAVEVNGFRLEKFVPGQTEFKYIANAKYGNMSVGENVYQIVAYGPDGKTAGTTIKIVYTPLTVPAQ